MEAVLRTAARRALMRMYRAERREHRVQGQRLEAKLERLIARGEAALAFLDAEDAIRALGEPVRWGKWEHRIGPAGEMGRYRVDRGRIGPPGMQGAA